MPHRIDVELTSARGDGSWTWRAAGARQPKGVLDGSVLYQGAKVGDVVRAEAEFELEGIVIKTVFPPKAKSGAESEERLEVIGPPREPRPGVTTTFVPKAERPRRPDRGAPGEERRRTGRPPGERPTRGRDDAAPRPGRRPDQAARRSERRPSRTGEESSTSAAPAGERRAPRPGRAPKPQAEPARPVPRRLTPGSVHRNAVLESLAPEQRAVAEQLLRGGLPAVRQAIAAENEKATAEGRPQINADPLVDMAEELLPRLKAAAWRDRAEAATAIVDEIGLRDLRSVVASADASARDEETRLLASNLRQALDRRLDEQAKSWTQEIGANLDEGRVVRALRLSARPPDPSMRFPADLAVRLAEAAGAAMAPDTPVDRWLTLLDAVAGSPVRRNVKPAGLPESPGEEFLHTARLASGRVPAVATLLGLPMPPPPGPAHGAPRPGARPPRPPRPARPAPPARRRTPVPAPVEAPAFPTSEGAPTVEAAAVAEAAPKEEPASTAEQTPTTDASPPVETSGGDSAVVEVPAEAPRLPLVEPAAAAADSSVAAGGVDQTAATPPEPASETEPAASETSDSPDGSDGAETGETPRSPATEPPSAG